MPTDIVLDVSVVVAAVSSAEGRHHESLRFIQEIHTRGVSIVVPAYFLLELYAVLTRKPRELKSIGFMTANNPITVQLMPIGSEEVEEILAWTSATLPGKSPTRGADLAYVGVAKSSGLPLVTLDGGLHQFHKAGISIYYPDELLQQWHAES